MQGTLRGCLHKPAVASNWRLAKMERRNIRRTAPVQKYLFSYFKDHLRTFYAYSVSFQGCEDAKASRRWTKYDDKKLQNVKPKLQIRKLNLETRTKLTRSTSSSYFFFKCTSSRGICKDPRNWGARTPMNCIHGRNAGPWECWLPAPGRDVKYFMSANRLSWKFRQLGLGRRRLPCRGVWWIQAGRYSTVKNGATGVLSVRVCFRILAFASITWWSSSCPKTWKCGIGERGAENSDVYGPVQLP